MASRRRQPYSIHPYWTNIIHITVNIFYSSWRCFHLYGSVRPLHPLRVAWNRCLLLQKPQLHLYRSQIIDPKPKGRQPLLAFALLFAAIVLFVRKSSYNLSDISIISPLLARVGSVRWVCGDLEGFFWSSAYSVLKRHQEELHWFFYIIYFFPLLASPKFLYREPAGGPPCRCCFNSATQNGVGQNRLLQWRKEEGEEQAQKVYRNSLCLSVFLSWDEQVCRLCREFLTKASPASFCWRWLRSVN